jgi:hypothetical protein
MPIGEGTPNRSLSMGCNESQVKDFNEHLKKHGVRCAHYMPDGRLETTSNKSRNQVVNFNGTVAIDIRLGRLQTRCRPYSRRRQ